MANIITRAGKGAPLSWNEADANFINLNTELAVHIDGAIDAHASSAIGYLPAGTGAVATDVQTKLREFVSVKDFGAVGDGVTDDTAAIQAAIDAVESSGGGEVLAPDIYNVAGNLTIKNNVHLVGTLTNPEVAVAGQAFSVSGRRSRIILASTATITVKNSSGFKGFIIHRNGIAAGEDPSVTFSGTAITVKGAGAHICDLIVIGFNRCISANSSASGERAARTKIERVIFDCINGISMSYCYDVVHIDNCIGNDVIQATTTTRSGTAFEFAEDVDWGKITNCFAYGYSIGFRLYNVDDCTLIGCGADYLPSGTSTSVGYEISGTSRTTKLISCQSAAQGTAVYVDNGTSAIPRAIISECSFWDNDTYGVRVVSGASIITGCHFYGGSRGVNVDSSSGSTIVGNIFTSVTTPITLATSAFDLSKVSANRFASCTDGTVGIVETFDNQRDLITYRSWNTNNVGARFTFDKARGSANSASLPNSGDATINFMGRGWTGSTWGNSAQLRAQFDGAPSATNTAGRFIFSTTPSGTTSLVDNLELDNGGNLRPIVDNANTCGGSGKRWSAIWAANGTIQTSDERTKENIQPSALGLDFIKSLRPVSYTWKVGSNEVVRQVYRDADGNECDPNVDGAIPAEIITREKPGSRTHWGLIAQEVKAATDAAGVDFGGWVLSNADDQDSQQALRYDQFIAPLIKAVQELSAEVQILKSKFPE